MKISVFQRDDGKSFVIDVSEVGWRQTVTPDMKLDQEPRLDKLVDEVVNDLTAVLKYKMKLELKKLG